MTKTILITGASTAPAAGPDGEPILFILPP
jgi:hypothetical protein